LGEKDEYLEELGGFNQGSYTINMHKFKCYDLSLYKVSESFMNYNQYMTHNNTN
jgi:hypothetical protein